VGVCDVLGIAAGYQVTDNFINTVSTLANTNVANLTTIYQTMNNVVTGAYGNTSAGPVVIPGGNQPLVPIPRSQMVWAMFWFRLQMQPSLAPAVTLLPLAQD
jgi:hypothetical protein